jgi:hypothetical protein
VQVWRVTAAATTAICILGLGLDFSISYGLDFIPCVLALKKGTLH